MSDHGNPSEHRRRYLRFAAGAALAAGVLAVIGYIVTGRAWGSQAAVAAVAGCGVSLGASLIGGLVLARPLSDPRDAVTRAFGANGLRLLAVAALAALVVALTGLPLKPFLLWTGIAYAALLAVDTRYALTATALGAGASEAAAGATDDSVDDDAETS